MSFAFTTPQMYGRTKTVTRRLGWWNLKPGEVVCAVQKGMGLKKGEKIKRIHPIRIIKTNPERLCDMRPSDVQREGFINMGKVEFITMFCQHNKVRRTQRVNRIEFEHL